ncbi:MAG: hypothetical protein RI953_378 [Pseudomonadota bacterium]
MKCSALMFFLVLGISACKPRGFNSQEAAQQNASKTLLVPGDFCSATIADPFIWSSAKVQSEIAGLVEAKGYKSSGLSAYAEVYLAMTAERDKARCASHGPMVPSSPLARRLNDALADIMTKGFVLTQRICLDSLQGSSVQVPSIGDQFCQVSKQALAERWTSLELSMASTAIYLTSLMGIALSALPHVDALWAGTPYQTLEQRIAAMPLFRPTYDSFNLFLSDNLHTVANVLLKNKHIDCGLFGIAARAAEVTKAPSLIFKDIRDTTFTLGVELAKSWPRGLHPLTAGEPTWNVGRGFGVFVKEPEALIALHEHGKKALGILKNPLMKIFKGKDSPTYMTFEGLTCEVRK